jgi:hypothetical protein
VQEHRFSVDLDAPREEVWEIFWYRGADRPQPPSPLPTAEPPGRSGPASAVARYVRRLSSARAGDTGTRIDILHPGDEVGEGLVRHCRFPVPKVLLSGGVGQSWEWLTQVRLHESWRYDAVGKPLWSRAEGFTRLEDLGDGRTRVHFTERYECFNPWMRRLGLERWVHQRISRDNDAILAALEGGLRWHRRRRARQAASSSDAAPPPT